MSQFAISASALDAAIGDDGDRGFVGVNQRLQLNQLGDGEVRESLNGRMDGYWRPRKAIVSRSGALTTGQVALQLPVLLIDTPKNISSATVFGGVVTITTSSAHGFPALAEGMGRVTGITYTGTNPGEMVVLTRTSTTQMTFPAPGVTGVTPSGALLQQAPINDAASANVRASCLFSDPNASNKEYAIVALDTVAKKIDLYNYSVTDIAYPPGQALGADTEMIQVFDKVMLFRDGQQALEWYPHGRPIQSASQATNTVTMTVKEHGLVVGQSIVVAGLTGGTPANGTFTVLAVSDQDTFTYTFGTSQTVSSFGVTSATLSDGFTLSPGGAYTQPQTFGITSNNISVTDGLVTVNSGSLGNTTVRAGDMIVVRESAIPELSTMVGKEYYVVEATTTTIKWYAPVGNLASSGSNAFEFGGRFSVGGGFMHQPGAPWGTYFQRRLWVPFLYSQSGAYNNATYTPRKITDEIAASDILDTTTYDQIANQFRISGGTADFVVGMHGFYDDGLIVFNRNSLHLVSGTQGSLNDTKVTELTSEVGCLARNTIVSRGNVIMFLSDNGVYGVEFMDEYNLRGADEPISKNIQPYIDRINKDLADKSVGVLFNNRYYLAVPLDSAPGIGDAVGNNSILIFNFLNKGWESLDTFGDSRFQIKNFVVGSAGVRNDLYAVTANGGLHQLEANDGPNDTLNVSSVGGTLVSAPITARLTTRGYDMGSLERKRFTDAQLMMQNLAGEVGEYSISFAAEDPDKAVTLGTTTKFLGGTVLAPSTTGEAETASIRCRVGGIRGYTGTLILNRTQGSPKINSVKLSASITNRQITSLK